MSAEADQQDPIDNGGTWAPTGEQAAAFDRRAIGDLSVPQTTLMENAGRSAALVLERVFPKGAVTVFVGSGNNGGDGLVLARTLAGWCRPVTVIQAASRLPDRGLFHGWGLQVLDVSAAEHAESIAEAIASSSVLVDGVFGTGISGRPREPQAGVLDRMNAAGAPLLALDVPSGVNADTGAVEGVAARASLTVAFGWPKLGTLLHPGRAQAGRLVAVEIGFPPVTHGTFHALLTTPGWAAAHRPRRPAETHKNAVGSLLLLAGRAGMAGAAVMAGRAALRAGAGFVRIASAGANREIVQSTLPEAVFVDAQDAGALREAGAASTAVAAGPGLGTGPESLAALTVILEAQEPTPLLLDADALNVVASGVAPPLADIGARRPTLVTPHAGEMACLIEGSPEGLPRLRPDLAIDRAAAWNCSVLLKGAPSLVADPDGGLLVDTLGSSDLAAAGMGDVLSGAAGSFMAQGCSPTVAGGLGLHVTGLAAALGEEGAGLMPEDVVARIPVALGHGPASGSALDLPFVSFDQPAPR